MAEISPPRPAGTLRYRGANLFACCGAHSVQDGLMALQYVLLPLLAQAFGLSYAQVGLLRGLSHVAMSGLEVPAGILAERLGERRLLVAGLAGAGIGYLTVAMAPSFAVIAAGFALAGAGAAFQHSLASAVIVRRFEAGARRRALGTYNAAGDAGKLAFTALFSAGIGVGLAWNLVITVLALAALAFALVALRALRGADGVPASPADEPRPAATTAAGRWGIRQPGRFTALVTIAFLDGTVQTVFLTFLAFVLLDKGVDGSVASAGVVLALAGGMVGKFACGFLAARIGDRQAFVLVQLLTMVGIALVVMLPATATLLVLPLVGLVVQGSSTVYYGAVADFVDTDRQSRGYALMYALSGAASIGGPFAFGALADGADLDVAMLALAALTALTVPLSAILGRSSRLPVPA